jgi:hypothetical protein
MLCPILIHALFERLEGVPLLADQRTSTLKNMSLSLASSFQILIARTYFSKFKNDRFLIHVVVSNDFTLHLTFCWHLLAS